MSKNNIINFAPQFIISCFTSADEHSEPLTKLISSNGWPEIIVWFFGALNSINLSADSFPHVKNKSFWNNVCYGDDLGLTMNDLSFPIEIPPAISIAMAFGIIPI